MSKEEFGPKNNAINNGFGEYADFLFGIKGRIQTARAQASPAVNRHLLELYLAYREQGEMSRRI